jgi:hypothetical protein
MILSKPNVVGVGAGYKVSNGVKSDNLSVVVLVNKKLPVAALSESALLPKKLDSVLVDVVDVGDLRALALPTDRFRPAPGGVSIGHYQITAGTLGVVVKDRTTGQRLILSNNHVLANSNAAQAGDPILQPGPYDGGNQASDTIAHLERFKVIEFGSQPGTCNIAGMVASLANIVAILLGSSHRLESYKVNAQAVNQVDAAVAKPVNDADVLDEILNIGKVTGVEPAVLGMSLRKSGRTTGFTTGTVDVIGATVQVSYGTGKVATFEDQIVSGPMSQGGDSGSLVVTGDDPPRAVGLLFAGSDQTTILSPIQFVLDALNVTF